MSKYHIVGNLMPRLKLSPLHTPTHQRGIRVIKLLRLHGPVLLGANFGALDDDF